MSKKKAKSPSRPLTSAEIRQSFLDFFEARDHRIVSSSSLVPGGDSTLLFTNAGMVQFKDVFLATGTRPYTRVADSQKCMRVAGKHNDLEDVGRDDSHHTFFEMLGNWSFGDYYKKEAITWAWQLLTEVWGLPKDKLWATCFEDEEGEIPRDDEAAENWRQQPGFNAEHLLFFGRQENFWEMAETGPCGPDSEIHFDRGSEYCDKKNDSNHVCQVNGDCQRYLELWNLVFIQYNRTSPADLEPLPSTHVDTGLGFERIVSVIQDVDSNYKTDLFTPLMDTIQNLTNHTDEVRAAQLTPYRVIADHARAAAFLIADGVVPGNIGRNYVCRMIIRRASRFGSKIDLNQPFLSTVAEAVIEHYSDFYPELARNRTAITKTLTDEEHRFHHTIEIGISHLMTVIENTQATGSATIPGDEAFELYATYGLPLEITRDIASEHGSDTDEAGFFKAMEIHRVASSTDLLNGELVDEDLDLYRQILADLHKAGSIEHEGVVNDPYIGVESEGPLLALIRDGTQVKSAKPDDQVAVVMPETHFYVEAGGQVSDTGTIRSVDEPHWEITIKGTRQPISGLFIHYGEVAVGKPKVGDLASANLDKSRRWDIMRNHTATHLLHAALRQVLGEHVRQAGSLVAPDRLRFDFTHPSAMKPDEIEQVEQLVNNAILENHKLQIETLPLNEATSAGAMALFGENYGDTVRTVRIGDETPISYELCGGTHVENTSTIGSFLITSEGSVASGIRRVEAVSGREAQKLIGSRLKTLTRITERLDASPETVEVRLDTLFDNLDRLTRETERQQEQIAGTHYQTLEVSDHAGVPVLTGHIPNVSSEVLRRLTDRFRTEHPSGVVVLASAPGNLPVIVAAISKDLVARGLHAGELIKDMAKIIGGGGGGKPTLAEAGGKDASKLSEALALVLEWVEQQLA